MLCMSGNGVQSFWRQIPHCASQHCRNQEQTILTQKISGPSGMMVHSQLSNRVFSCFCINIMLHGSCSLQLVAICSTSRTSMLAIYLISSGKRQIISLLDTVDGQKILIKGYMMTCFLRGCMITQHLPFAAGHHKGDNKKLRFVSSSLHGARLVLTKIHTKMLTSNPDGQPRL